MTKSTMKMWSKLFLFYSISWMFHSCSPKVVPSTNNNKEKKQDATENESGKKNENEKKTDFLVNKLDSLNNTKPAYFYGKAATSYKDKKNNFSFKTSIKIKSDSAATALITFAGVPIMNSIATKDSVKFQNKRNKCYSENSIAFFNTVFGYPFEFDNIVQLLLGLPITFEKEQEYQQESDNIFHILSTHKTLRLKTGTKMYVADDNAKEIFIKYFLSTDGNILEKVEIDNPVDKVKVIINYGNRSKEPATYNYPQRIVAKIITETNKIDVSLEFESMEINQIQEIFYTVPNSYVICQ